MREGYITNRDHQKNIPANIYLLKVNNTNTRKNNCDKHCEMCSKLTIKTPKRHH